jgi:hypothetical protein
LYQLIQLYPPPTYVKEASAEDLCGSGDLPAHAYADPKHLMYPCHTPAATWTSYGFFLQKQSAYRPADAGAIKERLQRYGEYHSITAALAEMDKLSEAHNRVRTVDELPDDDFAVVIKNASGVSERHCPMRHALEVVKAAEYLMKWRDEFPFGVRQDIADRVLNKAAAMGVRFQDEDMEEYLEKQAGHGLCSAKDLATCIVDRVYAARKGPGDLSPQQIEMLKLARVCLQKPSQVRNPANLIKIASLIDQYDRENGLHRDYGPNLPRVEDAVFGLTREKMASVAREHYVTTTGNIYKMADLERIPLREVEAGMGSDFANAVSGDGVRVDAEKLAAIVPTLPRGDAALFDRLMEDLGVMPLAQEKSAHAVKLSRDYLQKMANDYRNTVGPQGPKKGPRPDGLLAKFK